VYIYYGLSNFYQNHRRYVKSRDDHQLLGTLGPVSNECDPFARYPDPNNPSIINQVVPCGAIANSIFNGISGDFLLERFGSNMQFDLIIRYNDAKEGRR
jgi:hypothetical protein